MILPTYTSFARPKQLKEGTYTLDLTYDEGYIGLRFAVGKHQKNIEAKFSYMKSLREDKMSALGIVALFNF